MRNLTLLEKIIVLNVFRLIELVFGLRILVLFALAVVLLGLFKVFFKASLFLLLLIILLFLFCFLAHVRDQQGGVFYD